MTQPIQFRTGQSERASPPEKLTEEEKNNSNNNNILTHFGLSTRPALLAVTSTKKIAKTETPPCSPTGNEENMTFRQLIGINVNRLGMTREISRVGSFSQGFTRAAGLF